MDWIDEETGEKYRISYSQELQEKIRKSLSVGNWLKLGLLIAMGISIIILLLIYFGTGIIGAMLRGGVC